MATEPKLEGERSAVHEVSDEGAFVRTVSTFRNCVSAEEGAEFPVEADRYHLIIAYACPWASRCMALRALKGLEDVITVSVVKPEFGIISDEGAPEVMGWVFCEEGEEKDCEPDPIYGARTVREVYRTAHPEYIGKYTVPVLFDKKAKRVVNNESSEIIRMFSTQFNSVAGNPELNLSPPELMEEIEAINERVYNPVNNGVYRCGFATKQAPYEVAVKELFDALDWLEDLLAGQRYLVGGRLTEADIRLFVTLIRFDDVYNIHFKCSKKTLREYPVLSAYTRDIYQQPGIASTVHREHIKRHYYGSHPSVNPYGLIPQTSDVDWTAPHGREDLP